MSQKNRETSSESGHVQVKSLNLETGTVSIRFRKHVCCIDINSNFIVADLMSPVSIQFCCNQALAQYLSVQVTSTPFSHKCISIFIMSMETVFINSTCQ